MKKPSNDPGFTLIELLVVIAIIGILASFILANLAESRAQARDAERLNDLKAIQVALELYYNRNKAYPTDLDAIAPYIEEVPHDPLTGRDESEDYQYEGSALEYGLAALSDDGEIWCGIASGGFSGAVNGVTPDQDCPFY